MGEWSQVHCFTDKAAKAEENYVGDIMFIKIPGSFSWLDPWVPICNESAKSVYRFLFTEKKTTDSVPQVLLEEFYHELCPSHPLFSAKCRVVAYCRDDEDSGAHQRHDKHG